MAEPRTTRGSVNLKGGKSIDMIRSQRDRINGQIRYALMRADELPAQERVAEIERLITLAGKVDRTRSRYEDNIFRQPDQERLSNRQRAIYREMGRSPEEMAEAGRRIAEINRRRNSIRYPRSVYANRRG